MTEATNQNPPADQLNLKVKSQVQMPWCRTAKRCFSRSRTPPSSRNSWMPTASAKMYQSTYAAFPRQCSLPLRWRTPSWGSDPQGPRHGERRRDWCRDWTGWRCWARCPKLTEMIVYVMLIILYSFLITITIFPKRQFDIKAHEDHSLTSLLHWRSVILVLVLLICLLCNHLAFIFCIFISLGVIIWRLI